MQRISILSGTNLNRDSDLSGLVDGIINEGVINGLTVSTTQVTAGRALVKVKRDATPDKEFYVLYETEDIVTITPTNNQYIYIEVDQAKINDGSSNSVDGSGIGEIKCGAVVPSVNCLILAQMNGSGVIITTDRQNISLKNIPQTGKTAHRLFYTDTNGTTQELAFGTNGQVLGFTGINTAPEPVSPTVDIDGLSEKTVLAADDMLVSYDPGVGNVKHLAKASITNEGLVEMCTDTEAETGSDESRYINSKQLIDNIQYIGVVASDIVQMSANTERLTTTDDSNTGGYVRKVKEFKINNYKKGGTVKIKWEMRGVYNGITEYFTIYAGIKKSGVNVGTIQSTTSNTYLSFEATITGVIDGDTIELWNSTSRNSFGVNVGMKNCTLCFDEVKYPKLINTLD